MLTDYITPNKTVDIIRSFFSSEFESEPKLLVISVDLTFSSLYTEEVSSCIVHHIHVGSINQDSYYHEWETLSTYIGEILKHLNSLGQVFNGIYVCESNPEALLFRFLRESLSVPVVESSLPSLCVSIAVGSNTDNTLIVTDKSIDLWNLGGKYTFVSVCCKDVKIHDSFLVSKAHGREIQVVNGIRLAIVVLKNLCFGLNARFLELTNSSDIVFVLPVSGSLIVDVFSDHYIIPGLKILSLDKETCTPYVEDLYTLALNAKASSQLIQLNELTSGGIVIVDAGDVGYAISKECISTPLTSYLRSVVSLCILRQKKFCLLTFSDEIKYHQESIIQSQLPNSQSHLYQGSLILNGIDIDSWVSSCFEYNGKQQFGIDEESFITRTTIFENGCKRVLEEFGSDTAVVIGCSCVSTELQYVESHGIEIMDGTIDSLIYINMIKENKLHITSRPNGEFYTAMRSRVLQEVPTNTTGCIFGISMISNNKNEEFVESRLLSLYEDGVITRDTPLLCMTTKYLYRHNVSTQKEKTSLNSMTTAIIGTYKKVLKKTHNFKNVLFCDIEHIIDPTSIDKYVDNMQHILEENFQESDVFKLADLFSQTNDKPIANVTFLVEELWFHHFGMILSPTVGLKANVSFNKYVYFTTKDNESARMMFKEASNIYREHNIQPPRLGWAVNKIFPLERRYICHEDGSKEFLN